MRSIRRLGAAAVMASLIASGLFLGTARIEAAGKKQQDSQTAICDYLRLVINYPYVHPYIKLWATSLYNYYGCTPAL